MAQYGTQYGQSPTHGTNLVDLLDRVLDKGLVVAGDIRVSLANVELLTIRIRLLVCSIDKAEQIGLNWWRYDQGLVQPLPAAQLPATAVSGQLAATAPVPVETAETIARLEARIEALERQLRGRQEPPPAPSSRRRRNEIR